MGWVEYYSVLQRKGGSRREGLKAVIMQSDGITSVGKGFNVFFPVSFCGFHLFFLMTCYCSLNITESNCNMLAGTLGVVIEHMLSCAVFMCRLKWIPSKGTNLFVALTADSNHSLLHAGIRMFLLVITTSEVRRENVWDTIYKTKFMLYF